MITKQAVNTVIINKGTAQRTKFINNDIGSLKPFNTGWLELEGVVIEQTPIIQQSWDYGLGAMPVGYSWYNTTTKKNNDNVRRWGL